MFTKSYLSIELGSHTIKLMEGSRKGGQLSVTQAVTVPMPAQTYQDGKIIDVHTMAQVISNTLRMHTMKSIQAVLSLNSSGVISREIVLPNVKADELERMVQYEIQRFLPLEAALYVIQHRVLDTATEAGKQKVLVAAMPKHMVEGCEALIKELKLKPLALDLSTNCFNSLIKPETVLNGDRPVKENTYAFFDMGHHYIQITIYSGGILKFSRTIEGGGSEIDVALSEALEISELQAEKMKVSMSAISQGSEAVHQVLELWGHKIQRVFQFYESRGGGQRIAEVFVYGGTSNLQGLPNTLSGVLGIPVTAVKNITGIALPAEMSESDVRVFLNTAGAIAANR